MVTFYLLVKPNIHITLAPSAKKLATAPENISRNYLLNIQVQSSRHAKGVYGIGRQSR